MPAQRIVCNVPDAPHRTEEPPPPAAGLDIAPGLRIAPEVLRFTFSRSSGPGGQNVNKRSTKAELRLALLDLPISHGARRRTAMLAGTVGGRVTDAGELLLSADENRSQRMNRDACLDRLRELLLRALPEPKVRRATKPTKGSQKRRIEGKVRRGEVKKARRRPADD